MNFLQLKLIFDSFSRLSCFVATSPSASQDGANESAESLTASVNEASLGATEDFYTDASADFHACRNEYDADGCGYSP